MPMPPRSLSDAAWLPGKLTWVFGTFAAGLSRTNGGLNYRWSPVFAAMMLYGYWALWREQRDAALFLLLSVVVVICLSAAAVYPFTARLIVFLVPFFLLATAAGAAHLLTHWPPRVQFLMPVALAILGGAPIYAVATALPPSRSQHVRPILERVSQRQGDRTYVFYGSDLAFRYYASRLGIRPEGVIHGRCRLSDPREYLRELDGLRGGKRVWIVVTHLQLPAELELIVGYLDQIGRRLETLTITGSVDRPIEGAYGYLYDLSDAKRLASASAEAFPLMLNPVTTSWGRWGCYGVTDGAPPS